MTTEYNPSEMSLTINGIELNIEDNAEIYKPSQNNTYFLKLELNVEQGSPEEEALFDYFFGG